jgi:hypothetical protein
LRKIAYRNRDVSQTKTEIYGLNKKLGIENEVVAVPFKGNYFQDLTAIHAEATVKLAQVLTQAEVFEDGQGPIANVLPPRHATAERLSSSTHPVPQDYVTNPQFDKRHSMGYDPRVILIVRVNHHNDVRPVFQTIAVAGFLVTAVTAITVMDQNLQSHAAGQGHRSVGAPIIHEQDVVHATRRKVSQGGRQGLLRVISR